MYEANEIVLYTKKGGGHGLPPVTCKALFMGPAQHNIRLFKIIVKKGTEFTEKSYVPMTKLSKIEPIEFGEEFDLHGRGLEI